MSTPDIVDARPTRRPGLATARGSIPARGVPLALAVAAAALIVAAFFRPWWSFWLYAPQYPGGLRLDIGLTGMSGDVHEIDLLNHYIGMKHLEDAAPLERRFAVYGVMALVFATLGLAAARGRRFDALLVVPAASLPVVFLADSAYWLVSYGHHLDPRAPLKIGSFTPQLFGNGRIGQFETFAQPAVGFWLAVAALACVVVAAGLRRRGRARREATS